MALHLAAHPLDYVLVPSKLRVDRPLFGHQLGPPQTCRHRSSRSSAKQKEHCTTTINFITTNEELTCYYDFNALARAYKTTSDLPNEIAYANKAN